MSIPPSSPVPTKPGTVHRERFGTRPRWQRLNRVDRVDRPRGWLLTGSTGQGLVSELADWLGQRGPVRADFTDGSQDQAGRRLFVWGGGR